MIMRLQVHRFLSQDYHPRASAHPDRPPSSSSRGVDGSKKENDDGRQAVQGQNVRR